MHRLSFGGMEMERELAPDKAAPRDRVVEHEASVTRCPFCHEGVSSVASDVAVCKACLARHHSACWGERGACAACGQRRAFTDARPWMGSGRAVVVATVL